MAKLGNVLLVSWFIVCGLRSSCLGLVPWLLKALSQWRLGHSDSFGSRLTQHELRDGGKRYEGADDKELLLGFEARETLSTATCSLVVWGTTG